MKKIMIFLMAAVALSASAAKKDKKKVAEPVKPAVVLTTGSDSLSYASGYAQTQGLVQFLLSQKMDTTYMADFIRGLQDAVKKADDPSFKAYALGLDIQKQLSERMVPGLSNELKDSPDSLVQSLFYEGFSASLNNDTTLFNQEGAQKFFQERLEADREAKIESLYGKNRRDGQAFLAANALKEGVVTLPSGLQYKVITEGNGVKPASKNETVTVKYEGKLIDGTIFDSSYTRDPQTTDFKPSQVIKGWTEALMLMSVGSTYELYIPYELAYGEREAGKIPPYSTLIFKVELIDCDSAKAAQKASEEAAAAEKTAKKPGKKVAPKKK